jgi:hypothetical protein
LHQGNQHKEQDGNRGKRFHVCSPSVGTWSVWKVADRNLSGSCELSGNHAPTAVSDTLRRIKDRHNEALAAAHSTESGCSLRLR